MNLLRFDNLFYVGLFLEHFRIDVTHLLHHRRDKLIQERFVLAKSVTEPGRPAQNTPRHVAASFVRRQDTVGDGKGEHADMIGNGAVCNQVSTVFLTQDLLLPADEGLKEIGIIAAGLVLKNSNDAFQSRTRVHMLLGQVVQRSISIAVVLNEDEIPQLPVLIRSVDACRTLL